LEAPWVIPARDDQLFVRRRHWSVESLIACQFLGLCSQDTVDPSGEAIAAVVAAAIGEQAEYHKTDHQHKEFHSRDLLRRGMTRSRVPTLEGARAPHMRCLAYFGGDGYELRAMEDYASSDRIPRDYAGSRRVMALRQDALDHRADRREGRGQSSGASSDSGRSARERHMRCQTVV
jgi:hypothetical protein